jgi:hypothetical protein
MQEIDYSGIVDMGYRYDRRDGKYKLLDVNPRVGATFRLFVGSNGMDVVRALYLNLTGQPVRSGRAREGRKWIVEQSDLLYVPALRPTREADGHGMGVLPARYRRGRVVRPGRSLAVRRDVVELALRRYLLENSP